MIVLAPPMITKRGFYSCFEIRHTAISETRAFYQTDMSGWKHCLRAELMNLISLYQSQPWPWSWWAGKRFHTQKKSGATLPAGADQ